MYSRIVFINLKKIFFKIIFCIFSKLCVQCMILAKILCTFFEPNSSFNACFEFFMWITYSYLSCKSATSFSVFSIFIVSGKKSKLLWRLGIFSGYWTSASIIILYRYLHYRLLGKLYWTEMNLLPLNFNSCNFFYFWNGKGYVFFSILS